VGWRYLKSNMKPTYTHEENWSIDMCIDLGNLKLFCCHGKLKLEFFSSYWKLNSLMGFQQYMGQRIEIKNQHFLCGGTFDKLYL
jgi:hypothetical protein